MSLTLLGVNHRTAPVEVRERLVWPAADLPVVVTRILARGGSGAVLLSTCNRIEFYIADASSDAVAECWQVVGERLGSSAQPFAYLHTDRDAGRHLFRVAAGLDSMIVGESEIQGQVRHAWESAHAYAGPVLNRLFPGALQAGGRVRSQTALGTGAASVPSASVELARRILGPLAGRQALVLGSGEMAELAMRCLAAEGVRTVMVAHDHLAHATSVAERLGGRAVEFDEAWTMFGDVDLALCSTAAPHTIVTSQKIAEPLSRRTGRPLCILDIAVPRDVDSDVADLEDVFLYDIDDLQGVVTTNLGSRAQEMPRAERIVEDELRFFWDWHQGRTVAGTIRALREQAEKIRRAEVAEALTKLDHLSSTDRDRVEHLSRAILNRFLHEPTLRLRDAAGNGDDGQLTDTLEYLFNLETTSEGDSKPE